MCATTKLSGIVILLNNIERKLIVKMTGNQIITKSYRVELSSTNVINFRSLIKTNFVDKLSIYKLTKI